MDELTLLRGIDHDPAAPSADAIENTRASLAAAFAGERESPARHTQSRATRSLHRRRRLVWAAGIPLVAAITVLLVLVNLSGGVSVPGLAPAAPQSASAAEVLEQTATLSAAAPDLVVAAGQYLRVSTTAEHVYTNVIRGSVDGDTTARWGWIERTETQLFIPGDRSHEWVWLTDSTPETPGGDVVESWGADAARGRENLTRYIWDIPAADKVWRFRDGVLQTPAIDGGPLSPRLELATTMPADPVELLGWYRQQAAGQTWLPAGDAGAFALMTTDLRWNLFPAEQRGHIWRAMAELPGIVITDNGTSAAGEPTVTLALASPESVTAADAITDPEVANLREITIGTTTGTLLASRVFVPSPLTAEGTPLYPASTPWLAETFTTEVVNAAP